MLGLELELGFRVGVRGWHFVGVTVGSRTRSNG